MEVDAVVLAGGAGRRLGGADKPALPVGGRSMLDRVLAALAGTRTVVVVGPVRPVARPVVWAWESPARSGPLAALAAGVAALGDGSPADLVVVVAADLPHLARADVDRLVAAAAGDGVDGSCLVDESDEPQPLAAAYASGPLRAALAAAAPHADRPLRPALAGLRLARVPGGQAARDVDTPDDLRRSRVDEYVARLCELLEVDPSRVDVPRVLDLARDAAHHVERPPAPVTTFVAGLAAGLAGGSAQEVERAIGVASELAVAWASPSPPSTEDAPPA